MADVNLTKRERECLYYMRADNDRGRPWKSFPKTSAGLAGRGLAELAGNRNGYALYRITEPGRLALSAETDHA